MTGNDWNRSELLVMKTLERIETMTTENSRDILTLKAHARTWGFIAGMFGSIASGLVVFAVTYFVKGH